jgi:hypothetical protein
LALAASCGSDQSGSEPGSTSQVTTAPLRFDGRLTIVELELDEQAIPLENRPSLLIDAEFGGLEVRPGCNTRFGSFTLTADGAASFTVPGGTTSSCDALGDQEAAIDDALGRVEAWSATEEGVVFTGPGLRLVTTGPTADS